jgi:high affinity choline transporter 7
MPSDSRKVSARSRLAGPATVGFLFITALTIGLGLATPAPQWGGLIAMSIFYAATYWLGVWASARAEDGSFRDMVLAGRRLGLGVGVFTMTATWVDGGYVNGTAEQTYANGLLAVQAPWGYALSLLIGGLWFAPVMRRHGFTTLLDPFDRRFGKKAAAVLYLPALTGEVVWTAAILTALGTTFGIILDLDSSWSIALSAAVVLIYTITGGLWAVALTDVAQLVVLVIGLWIVVPFISNSVGGFSHAWATYQTQVMAKAPPINWWTWADSGLLLVFGGIPWHVYFQRVLAARDEQVAKRLSIYAGLFCVFAAIPPMLIGILASAADWHGRGLPAPEATLIMPYVLRHLTPPVVAAIGLGAVSAAVMSSIDSSVLSASSMAAWNVYRPLMNPDASSAALTAVVKRMVVVVGVAATLMAIKVQSIYTLWVLCSDLVYCILFPQLLLALWDRRANRWGSYAAMAVSVAIRAGAGEPMLGLPMLLPLPVDASGAITIPIKSIAMVAGLVSMWVVSRATQSACPPIPLEPEPDVIEPTLGPVPDASLS